jgi:PEP-CTERM/exosortase A-associated glycosyltransferase
MRILHVLDHSIPIASGYSFRTRAILQHQRARSWTTEHLTSIKHTVSTTPEEVVDGYRFHRTFVGPTALARLPVIGQLAVIRTLDQKLRELIPNLKPDILHAHSPSLTGIAAIRAGRRYRLPVVYEVRALWEESAVVFGTSRAGGLRYRATRALETYVLSRADAVTTICAGLSRELASRGIEEDVITIIPNAVDVERFTFDPPADDALARRLMLDGKRVVGFAGSFYEYEGLDLLLAAMSRLVAKKPELRLLLVGGGEHEQALKRQARETGIEDRVVFTGSVPHDDVSSYYSLMEALVYPRRPGRALDLTTPLKPLEAMAQGKIVVASDVGGHRELIRDGETGVLFPAGDVGALAETLLRVLDDPQRRDIMRRAARRFVETERTWPQAVARYEAVYATAMARAQARYGHSTTSAKLRRR